MENKKQTAVQWLIEKINTKYGNNDFIITHQNEIQQAIAMEKEQIVHAHLTGLIHPLEIEATKQAQQYYNETYKQ